LRCVVSLAVFALIGAGSALAAECPPRPVEFVESDDPFDLLYPHHPSKLIAKVKRSSDPTAAAALEERTAVHLHRLGVSEAILVPSLRIRTLDVGPGGDERLLAVMRSLMASGDYEYVEPNDCVYLEQSNQDPRYADQWALKSIEAEQAWTIDTGSKNVRVAVIDSGADVDHDDLPADLIAWNVLEKSTDIRDNYGHGTHAAGIIGALHWNGQCIKGINKSVSLIVIKASEGEGSPIEHYVKAIEYAIRAGAHAINASWSIGRPRKVLEDALRLAKDANVVVVAAAGDDGRDLDRNRRYPCSFKMSNVICVTSLSRLNRRMSGANVGPSTVHLAAPAEEIYSTYPESKGGCFTRTGSSMAAANVTGVVALIRSKCSQAGPTEIISRIVNGAVRVDDFRGNTISGGRLNAPKALEPPCWTAPD
jgi:subtilisin family serine protease